MPQLNKDRTDYAKKINTLEEALDDLSTSCPSDLLAGGYALIAELESTPKELGDTTHKAPSKDKISYHEANKVLDDVTALTKEFSALITRSQDKHPPEQAAFVRFQTHCTKVADKAEKEFHGKSNNVKKILGAIALFISALMIIAAVLTVIAMTKGTILALAPLAVAHFGGPTGALMVTAKAAWSVALATGLLGVGSTAGAYLGGKALASGLQKGVSKKTSVFVKSLEKESGATTMRFFPAMGKEKPKHHETTHHHKKITKV